MMSVHQDIKLEVKNIIIEHVLCPRKLNQLQRVNMFASSPVFTHIRYLSIRYVG